MGDWLRELADVRVSAADMVTNPVRAAREAAVERALKMRREIEDFERRWPAPAARDGMAPAFSWDQLERQLADLVDTPAKVGMVRDLVSATRKMSAFKPPEMVLREILCLSWTLLDEGFQPELAAPGTI